MHAGESDRSRPGVYFVAVANTKNHNANLDDFSLPQAFEIFAQSGSIKR